jgi:hypothetical protein
MKDLREFMKEHYDMDFDNLPFIKSVEREVAAKIFDEIYDAIEKKYEIVCPSIDEYARQFHIISAKKLQEIKDKYVQEHEEPQE